MIAEVDLLPDNTNQRYPQKQREYGLPLSNTISKKARDDEVS